MNATEQIPRKNWRSYFDEFSKHMPALEATVEVTGRDLGHQILAEHMVLTGLSYDDKDEVFVIGLDAPGGLPEEAEHLIEHPQRIFVATGDDAHLEVAIDIEDEENHRHIVRIARLSELPEAAA